jgi:hypothetical protein
MLLLLEVSSLQKESSECKGASISFIPQTGALPAKQVRLRLGKRKFAPSLVLLRMRMTAVVAIESPPSSEELSLFFACPKRGQNPWGVDEKS